MAKSDSHIDLSFLWQTMGPQRYRSLWVVALVLLDTAMASLGIGLILPVFQTLLNPQHENRVLTAVLPMLATLDPDSRLAILALGTVLLFGLKAGITMFSSVTSANFLQTLRFYWVDCIGKNYLLGEYLRLAGRKQGELLNDWFNESLAATRFYQAYLSYFSSSILACTLVGLGVLVNWQAMLAMLFFGGGLVLLVRSRMYGGSARLSKVKVQLNQKMTTSMVEDLAHSRDIKLMLAENSRLEQLSFLGDKLKSAILRAAILAEIPRVSGEFLTVLAIMIFVVVGMIVLKIPVQEIMPMLAFFFIAFYRLVGAGSMGMASRVKALNELHSVRLVNNLVSQVECWEDRETGLSIEGIETDILLNGVGFHYGKDRPVLEGVHVIIPRAKVTFLIGPSGAGKSTLLDILMRLIKPTTGDIEVNGHSVAEFRLQDWRRCFGYVSQDASLFNGSIRMNLQLAKPNASNAEIAEACRLAGAEDFILALPEAYDTLVGDRGYSLSGGERKRIAIARAIISRPSVLILDEATTSFEQSLERELIKAMRIALPDLTVIQVTHRLQSAGDADWVIAVKDGRVLASGSWEDVQETLSRSDKDGGVEA